MFKVRTTKTASGKTAVQVVKRAHQQTKIIKHIGSAGSEDELHLLRRQAEQYIIDLTKTNPLFPEFFGVARPQLLLEVQQVVDRLSFLHTYHTFAHEFLSEFYARNGFTKLNNNLLRDLVFMRIIEPCSKLRSVEIFNKYFGDTYTQNMLYKGLPAIRLLKQEAEQIAIFYAKKYLAFDFSLVFYDVTTLYFETFKEDEDTKNDEGNITKKGLRKNGYGKERKPGQPQILIGLVVNNDGYPIAVDMFEGNTFEGHTMLPIIKRLQQTYNIKTLTIVADAAMLNRDNMKELKSAELFYIVGAKLGNLYGKRLQKIAKELNKTEGVYYKARTKYGTLICDYSEKRAKKDRSDRKKQLLKAQYQIDNPAKVNKKARFVQETTKATLTLNQKLVEEDILREGIKGYYTNLKNIDPKLIISKYKELWHVEKSFRIAKSDLEARPIFHWKKESIETHLLIVFISLCLAKSIELKTGYSIKKVKDMIWDILDIEFIDTQTKRKFIKRMDTSENPMLRVMNKLTSQDKTQ